MICGTQTCQQQQQPLAESVEHQNLQPKSQPQDATVCSAEEMERRRLRAYHKAWRDRNPDRIKLYQKRYWKRYGDVIKEWRKGEDQKAKIAESNRKQREKNKAAYAARNKEWYEAHKHTPEFRAQKRAYAKKWRETHVESERLRVKRYAENNREKVRARFKRLRRESIQFSLKERICASINRALRRNWVRKSKRTMDMVGCSVEELKAHIEAQFVNGMSWATRKTWHIDHYVPIAAFDLTVEEEQKAAFNWRNLRPLSGHENHVKSDTIPDPLPAWLPVEIQRRIKERAICQNELMESRSFSSE